MFNVEKTLLFIVTIITSAAFLFFIPHFHLSIEFGSLITIHRIKSFLTLLSPIIFGAVTAYIAYQQHCLAKTQANISRDQRDIAHNKQRIENYEKLYEIQESLLNLYNEVMNFEWEYPREVERQINVFSVHRVSDLIGRENSIEVEDWARAYIASEKKIYEVERLCDLIQIKCKCIFDDYTNESIMEFIIMAARLRSLKQTYIVSPMYEEELDKLKGKIFDHCGILDTKMRAMISSFKPYMDIRDIISPRKFE